MKVNIPRRDESEKKSVNTRIRMTPSDSVILSECAEYLNATRSDVLMAGLYMVYEDVQEDKKSN